MANFYIAVSVKQDRNETTFTERKNPEYNPGYYAFVIRCSENDNLLPVSASAASLPSRCLLPLFYIWYIVYRAFRIPHP